MCDVFGTRGEDVLTYRVTVEWMNKVGEWKSYQEQVVIDLSHRALDRLNAAMQPPVKRKAVADAQG